MRILFMGTPEFSIPSLEAIVSEDQELLGIITQPDRARGRGKLISYSPVKEWALKRDYRVYQPQRVRDEDFIVQVEQLYPDLIVTAAYGQILPKRILDIPRLGCINVHASLLPKYRGAAPIQQALLDGEAKTGITIIYMDEGMDTGDIIFKREIDINSDENYGQLHDRLSLLGGEALKEVIKIFKEARPKGFPQDHGRASYCEKVEKSKGKIDWSLDVDRIKNHVRAYTPWPGAYTYIDNLRLKVWKIDSVAYSTSDGVIPGQILYADEKNGLVIGASKGLLRLSKIQAPGKKAMEDVVFLRGNKIIVD